MSLLYYGVSATNAFDSLGHFARTEPQVGGCASYVQRPTGGCSANFSGAVAAAAGAASLPVTKTPAPQARVASNIARIAWKATSGAAQPQSGAVKGLLDYLIGGGR